MELVPAGTTATTFSSPSSQLSNLNVKQLRDKAAKELGIDADAIENARDGDDPKGELIKLIQEAKTAPTDCSGVDYEAMTVKELRGAGALSYMSL